MVVGVNNFDWDHLGNLSIPHRSLFLTENDLHLSDQISDGTWYT